MHYDAVIVGSGPAGSLTARFAAEKGAKVLIIERRAEVGVPVLCGEGISQKVDHFKVLKGERWIAVLVGEEIGVEGHEPQLRPQAAGHFLVLAGDAARVDGHVVAAAAADDLRLLGLRQRAGIADLDDEVLRRFKAESEKTGMGYQTLINDALARCSALRRKPSRRS